MATSAVVLLDVVLGPGVNLWYGVVIRGDLAPSPWGRASTFKTGPSFTRTTTTANDRGRGGRRPSGHAAWPAHRQGYADCHGRDLALGHGDTSAGRVPHRRRHAGDGRQEDSAALRGHGRPGPVVRAHHGRGDRQRAAHRRALSGYGPPPCPRRLRRRGHAEVFSRGSHSRPTS